jgi:uncharacterized damage-inducible protein DinB
MHHKSLEHLKSASSQILDQLANLMGQISPEEYSKPLPVLSGNTIGKHVRHVVEFYQALFINQNNGTVNYDKRERDLVLETNPNKVIEVINQIIKLTEKAHQDVHLILEASFIPSENESVEISSNLSRELAYNIEHAIHHMAIVQIAVRNSFPDLHLPNNFGVAVSTLKHQDTSLKQA